MRTFTDTALTQTPVVSTLYQNYGFTLTYDDEAQLAVARTTGFLSSKEFREVFTWCARFIEEQKPLRWLADNRNMKAIRQADQEWFVENVLPILGNSSIRRNATVVSEDIFNKMAVEQIRKRADDLGDMLLLEFEDFDQALAWVLQPID